MNKKLLIGGSIIAVVILVLAGLSPVVGYNSVELSAKESPLFNVRTKRAIKEKSETLTCNYLGKGQLMTFPVRDSKAIHIQRLIDGISSMNDVDFNRFKDLLINHLKKDNTIKDENIRDVVDTLQWIRVNPGGIGDYYTDVKDGIWTEWYICTSGSGEWKPGCIIYFTISIILFTIYMSVVMMVFAIYTYINRNDPSWCHPATCFCI